MCVACMPPDDTQNNVGAILSFMDFASFANCNNVPINSSQSEKGLFLLLFQAVVGLNRKCGFGVSYLTLTVTFLTARVLCKITTACCHQWRNLLTALHLLLPSLVKGRLLPLFISLWPAIISSLHRLYSCVNDFPLRLQQHCNFSARKHQLLTLISFSLLRSAAATLGFHSRSVASSFFVHFSHSFKSDFKGMCVMDFAPPSFSHICSY